MNTAVQFGLGRQKQQVLNWDIFNQQKQFTAPSNRYHVLYNMSTGNNIITTHTSLYAQ